MKTIIELLDNRIVSMNCWAICFGNSLGTVWSIVWTRNLNEMFWLREIAMHALLKTSRQTILLFQFLYLARPLINSLKHFSPNCSKTVPQLLQRCSDNSSQNCSETCQWCIAQAVFKKCLTTILNFIGNWYKTATQLFNNFQRLLSPTFQNIYINILCSYM